MRAAIGAAEKMKLQELLELADPNLSFAIAWAAAATVLYKFVVVGIPAVVPALPEEFFKSLEKSSRKRRILPERAVMELIDGLFLFENRSFLRAAVYAPSLKRTVVASVFSLALSVVLLTLLGFNVIEEIVRHISGSSIEEKLYSSVNAPWGRHAFQFPKYSVLIFGFISGVSAFFVNLAADYVSVTQTRYFVKIIRDKNLSIFIFLPLDLIFSILILLVSLLLSILVSSIILYVYFVYFDYNSDILGIYIGRPIAFLYEFVVPSMLVVSVHIADGVSNLLGMPLRAEAAVDGLENIYGFGMPFPNLPNTFSLLVISSLCTSIVIWILLTYRISVSIVLLHRKIAKRALRWTDAARDPTRLLAFYIILIWTMIFILTSLICGEVNS